MNVEPQVNGRLSAPKKMLRATIIANARDLKVEDGTAGDPTVVPHATQASTHRFMAEIMALGAESAVSSRAR